jgi:predicted dehydrogenase
LLNYGVIGYGYWGPNLVRTFARASESKVVAIADMDGGKRAQAAAAFPGTEVTDDPRSVIARPDIDVVAIATPVSTHYSLAKAALQAGKHIFVEKPFTARAQEAEELLEAAERRNLQIFIDHTFIYTGAVRKIKQVIERGDLGNVLYYDSVRINLGLFQHDVNVLWDLAVHDIAILDYILPDRPTAVSAVAVDPVGTQPASIGYLTLYYPSSAIAHIHASWLAPVKLRQTLIGGDKRMIVYNDLEPSEKVRIYDKGVEFAKSAEEEYRLRVGYRSGDMLAPQLDATEALAVAARHANECILEGKSPITSGHVGYRVVKVLEAADRSARSQGRIVSLDA